MKEINILMNSTTTLLTIIVVGGAVALLEWAHINNLVEKLETMATSHKTND